MGAEAARTLETGTQEILCRVERRVGVVTLNRADAKNALTMEMKRALHRVIPELGASADVGCVLLTGAGGAFCAGGDTKRMAREGRPPSPEERKRQLRWEHEIPRALHRLEKPTLAALPGPAAGAGFALALACDLRIDGGERVRDHGLRAARALGRLRRELVPDALVRPGARARDHVPRRAARFAPTASASAS